jgi:hypothetical protein
LLVPMNDKNSFSVLHAKQNLPIFQANTTMTNLSPCALHQFCYL